MLERIAAGFGPRVAAIVEACTDSPDGTSSEPWIVRKRRYLAHLLQNGGDAVARLSDIVATSATALLCVERESSICHRSAVADQLGVAVVSL